MSVSSPKLLVLPFSTVLMASMLSSCSTTGGGITESENLLKRGTQLVSLGEKQQKQGEANIARGHEMIQRGKAMEGSPAPRASGDFGPDRSNY
mgnify:CR=1 FL=1